MAGSNSFAAIVYPDALDSSPLSEDRTGGGCLRSGAIKTTERNDLGHPDRTFEHIGGECASNRLWIIKQDPRCAHKGRTQRSRFLPRMAHRHPTIARSSGAIETQSGDFKVALCLSNHAN